METSKIARRRVSVSGMLKKLGVSRSGYRAFLNHKPSNMQQRKESVKKKIKTIYDDSKQNYGAPKITKELQKSGEVISERTVGKYMKEMGIRAQWVKPWTTTTVWCTDITYIWTRDGFVYLTSIMDLYARKIIAWTLSDNMEVSCVINTINKAKERRNTDLPLIIHSDRGSQYVSKAYREATEKYQLSYSHTGYPYDNACIESFHSLIKREWLNRFAIADFNQAYRLVFEYIETFYNTVRSHSHCGYMSPNEFEKLYMYVANDGIQKKAS